MHTFSLLFVLVLTFLASSEAGLWYIKTTSWLGALPVSTLPALPAPTVTVQHAKHTVTTQDELINFLRPFVANAEDLQNLSVILLNAFTDDRWSMHFWVDSLLAVGNLELLAMKKHGHEVTVTVGNAKIDIPGVWTMTQVCHKKKATKEKCQFVPVPRGLTADEISFVARTLEQGIRAHPELSHLAN